MRHKTSAKGKATSIRKPRQDNRGDESERETFDLGAISGSESNEGPSTIKAKAGPSRSKRRPPPSSMKKPPTAPRKRKQVKNNELPSDENEFFDLNAINSEDESDESSLRVLLPSAFQAPIGKPSTKAKISRTVIPLVEVAKRSRGESQNYWTYRLSLIPFRLASPRSRLVRELSSLSISSPPTSPKQDVIILSD